MNVVQVDKQAKMKGFFPQIGSRKRFYSKQPYTFRKQRKDTFYTLSWKKYNIYVYLPFAALVIAL